MPQCLRVYLGKKVRDGCRQEGPTYRSRNSELQVINKGANAVITHRSNCLKFMSTFGLGIVLGCAATVLAKTDMSKFPLAKAAPADAFLAVSAKHNPERKFLDDYNGKVWEAFSDSGIMQDVWDLIVDIMPEDNAEQIEAVIDRFKTHVTSIQWSDMFGKEMVHVGRLSQTITAGSPYEGVLIGRMDPKAAEANYGHLKAILEEVCKLVGEHAGSGAGHGDADSEGDDESEGEGKDKADSKHEGGKGDAKHGNSDSPLSVVEEKLHGGTFARLLVSGYPGGSIVSVGHRGDLIVMSFTGDKLVKDCMDLLKGEAEKTSLIDSKRFKTAIDDMHEAEDTVVFFDIGKMFGAINGMVKTVKDMEKNDAEAQQAMGIVTRLIDDLSIIDYMVAVEWTDGYRTMGESLTTLVDGAKSRPLYKVFVNGKTADDFAKFIPKKAHTFSVGTGINMGELYRYIVNFIESTGPDGKSAIAEWGNMQKSMELDVEKDVMQLFEGPYASVNLGKDGGEWVMLMKVADEKKAESHIKRLLDTVNGMMNQGGGGPGGLILTPVTIAGKKGFTQISHPMLAMMGGGLKPPVVGCAEGHLIIGSSAQTISECIETSKGEAPNIKESKRFKDEILMPKDGKVDSISYVDQANYAGELQEMISGLGMGLGMAGMFAQGAPKEMRTILGGIPPILGKLVPVVEQMDFYLSTASVASFDGMKWRTTTVQNYKDPKDVKKYVKPSKGDDAAKSESAEEKEDDGE